MKNILLLIAALTLCAYTAHTQSMPTANQSVAIRALIDKYSQAREKKDTLLLKEILTNEIDQLVSTGEWRNGIQSSVAGMLKSSSASPGTRTLIVDKIRMLGSSVAIVDCRYEIINADGTPRKMWSSFIVIEDNRRWKISAIRNMLPSSP